MFALQIDAPGNGVIKCFAALEQDIHGFRIGTAHKRRFLHMLQAFPQPLVYKTGQEFHFFRAVCQGIADEKTDKLFRHVHVSIQVAECHFRLHHPEFRRMARSIGVLRPERGAKGINVAQGARERFPFQLAAYREVGRLAEEIPGGVTGSSVSHIQSRHAEHFSGPFAVTGGNNGSADPGKIPFLEKAVDGEGQPAAHAEHGSKQVGAGAQMGDGTQKLRRMPLFLQGIGIRNSPHQLQGSGAQFPSLPSLPGNQSAADAHGRPRSHFSNPFIAGDTLIRHDLQGGDGGTVIHLQKGKSLGITARTHPSLNQYVRHFLLTVQDMFHQCSVHHGASIIQRLAHASRIASPRREYYGFSGREGGDMPHLLFGRLHDLPPRRNGDGIRQRHFLLRMGGPPGI